MYEREQMYERAQKDELLKMSSVGGEVRKSKIADELVELAAKIAGQAEHIEDMAAKRLVPITLVSPTCGAPSEEKPKREYPPLFNEIRNHLWTIEQALHRLEKTIDRVEV